MTGIICSDHRPWSVTFGNEISQLSDDEYMLTGNSVQSTRYIDWSKASNVDILICTSDNLISTWRVCVYLDAWCSEVAAAALMCHIIV